MNWGFKALLSFVIVCGALNGCSTFEGPGELKSAEEESSLDGQPYSLLTPKFESSYLSPAPRNFGDENFFSKVFVLEWPVDRVILTQKFRPSSNPSHQGLDLGGKRDTPIKAAHSGIVVYAGKGFNGYGKMIIIEYSEQWATLYAHLNSFKVKTGEWVTSGQRIGNMGRTGRASGVHLHFELIRYKQPIDPLSLLKWKGEVALNSVLKSPPLPCSTLDIAHCLSNRQLSSS
ncbi:MAG: M23 family metallopeptidase [Bdellovibrionales bacterium]|nr:M23 family metallopeptidase [Bdellovibrionales bacterium]